MAKKKKEQAPKPKPKQEQKMDGLGASFDDVMKVLADPKQPK